MSSDYVFQSASAKPSSSKPCNGQITRNTEEWWHGSGPVNVTWNKCVLDSYADDAAKEEAIRMARLRDYAPFANARYSNHKYHYLSLFGNFISAKNIAQTESEVQFVRSAFCADLMQAYQHLAQEERTELLKIMGGSPSVPHDHVKYVVPYCFADAQPGAPTNAPRPAGSGGR